MISPSFSTSSADFRMLIIPSQVRAARGFLSWSRTQLGQISGVSAETIKNIEHGVFSPHETTLNSIISTFANQGVEFFNIASARAFGVVFVQPDTIRTAANGEVQQ